MLEILYKTKLEHREGCFVSELAEALGVSSPAVSRMLRRLDGRGWVERQINPGDRRNIQVSITPQGQRQLDETQKTLRLFGDGISRRLGEQDMQQLIILWNRLLDAMDEELETLLKEKQNHA